MSQEDNFIARGGDEDDEPQLPPHLIEKFLDNQQQNLINDAHERKLRERELELDSKHGEKILEYQAEFLRAQPAEQRKTMTRYAYIAGGFLIILLAFVLICLHLNKEDFLLKFIQSIGYFITTALGYWIGRNSKSKSKSDKSGDNGIQDAEVIE